MKFKKVNFVFCLLLVIASFSSLYFKSLNFGIDFTGGMLMEIGIPDRDNIGINKVRNSLKELEMGEMMVQTVDNDKFIIKLSMGNSNDRQFYIDKIKDCLTSKVAENVEFRKIEFIGADIGEEMVTNCALALFFTFLGIVFYTWYRFNWQYSIGMLLSLLHDLILTLGFMSFTQYEFNASSVAALLTILGFSVNDTVVVYDRIRENFYKITKTALERIINISLNETLSRTILTVVTTLLADAVLIFYGGETLKSFSVTIFVGIVIGTYSSIFVASPILLLFKPR